MDATGLIGLSPKQPPFVKHPTSMFLNTLYDSGVIKNKMFSFYISNYFINMKENGSRLLFGGYDLEKYAKPG